jgi:hypothetical protein
LPPRWHAAQPDTAELNALIQLSVQLRDRRIFAAVSQLARDSTRPFFVRAAAVIVVADYFNPVFVGRVHLASTGKQLMTIGERLHVTQHDGPERLGPDLDAAAERILRAFQADPASPFRGWANYVFVMTKELCQRAATRATMRTCPN